ALGPRMGGLAGEVADGVLLNWLTPEHAERSAEWIREAAAAARRPPPRLATYVRVAMGPEAAALVEAEGRRYAAIPAYADHFARMGAPPSLTAVAARTAGEVPDALARGGDGLRGAGGRALTAPDPAGAAAALIPPGRPRA